MNFLRSACALPLLCFVLISSDSDVDSLFFVIAYPFLYLPMVAPILLLVNALCEGVAKQLAWIMILPLKIIFITSGDPLVYLLSKLKPSLVPIKNYPILSWDVAMFITKE